jgi:hypothetical protein
MFSPSLSVSQAIRAHNVALTNLYFHHRETVLHIQNTLLTQILPNVLDELALGHRARDWAQEWLQDERKYLPWLGAQTAGLPSPMIKVSIFRTLKVRV